MGFFSDMTEEDFMEAPKEVAPVVLNTAAELEDETEADSLAEKEVEIVDEEDSDFEIGSEDDDFDDDEDVLGEVESAGIHNNTTPVKEETKKEAEEKPVGKKSVSKKKEPETQVGNLPTDTTYIGSECIVNGSIVCKGNCTVSGTVNGEISCGNLEIAPNGFVTEGVYSSDNVSVYGKVSGGITARNVTLFQSKTEGDVTSSEKVAICSGAILVGNLTATDADISGALKGNIDVTGPVTIANTAIVKGNIKAAHINIEPGAKVAGSVELCYGEAADISDDIFE